MSTREKVLVLALIFAFWYRAKVKGASLFTPGQSAPVVSIGSINQGTPTTGTTNIIDDLLNGFAEAIFIPYDPNHLPSTLPGRLWTGDTFDYNSFSQQGFSCRPDPSGSGVICTR